MAPVTVFVLKTYPCFLRPTLLLVPLRHNVESTVDAKPRK